MASLPKYDLMELPWTDVANWLKAGNDLVMIPVGSVEKHGSHVPLGVDSHTTMGSVERAAVKAKVVYSPLLPFGVSPHHMGEAGWGTGSVSLPTEVYRQVLYAIGRSLIFAGFNKLVYVSHHGTNMGAQGDALRTLRAETGCFCAYNPSFFKSSGLCADSALFSSSACERESLREPITYSWNASHAYGVTIATISASTLAYSLISR